MLIVEYNLYRLLLIYIYTLSTVELHFKCCIIYNVYVQQIQPLVSFKLSTLVALCTWWFHLPRSIGVKEICQYCWKSQCDVLLTRRQRRRKSPLVSLGHYIECRNTETNTRTFEKKSQNINKKVVVPKALESFYVTNVGGEKSCESNLEAVLLETSSELFGQLTNLYQDRRWMMDGSFNWQVLYEWLRYSH